MPIIDNLNPTPVYDVSVVIVNWNAGHLLTQTIQSLYSETRNVTFETIVVDNGSTDNSIEQLQQMLKQLHLISLPANIGFGAANNLGFLSARGRYVLVLNSDTIVLSTTLIEMVRFLDEHPDVGCVGCRHLNPDGTLQRSVDNFPNLLHDFLCFSDLYRLSILQGFLQEHYAWWGSHNHIREVDWVNGSCMMVRREVISQVGGFDEAFFIYAEEIDWCYRIRRCGWKICFTPEAEIIHFGGQSSKQIADMRLVLMYKGQYRFYRKNYPLWQYVTLRMIIIVIALPRILILFLLFTLDRKVNDQFWFVITQEPIHTDPVIMLRAWWRIIWLTTSEISDEEELRVYRTINRI